MAPETESRQSPARQGRASLAKGKAAAPSKHGRRLWLESLEDRRLLAVFMVSNLNDTGGGSLRSAVALANDAGSVDEIRFAAGLSGGTISLTSGEIEITDALTIDAQPLAANVTINANGLSRIFNITAAFDDYTFTGLNLTGGRTTLSGSAGSGGAIRSLTPLLLTLSECTISGNSTVTGNAPGGGIFASGDVWLSQSTVSGNRTEFFNSDGGGIAATGDVTLMQSTVNGNGTEGNEAAGGGIYTTGDVTLIESTVSGNNTMGNNGHGGGIYTDVGEVTLTRSTVGGNSTMGSTTSSNAGGGGIRAGGVTLTQSTVSGNSTAAFNAGGGGIFARGDVSLSHSTVSGNSTVGDSAEGGGIFAVSGMTLTHSTVTGNHASSFGGGVFQPNLSNNFPLSIGGSILAGNTAGGGGADLVKDVNSTLTVNYSLIGTGVTPTSGGNNVSTDDPQLAPLADNGGPTQTHAPEPGSPAIDAGFFDPAEFDQRGAPFVRIADGDGIDGGRIDIGSYEVQGAADFDGDSDVDGADVLAWQRGLGSLGAAATRANGNADGDGDVDATDLAVWKAQFGQPQAVLAAETAIATAATSGPAAVDAVFAGGDVTSLFAPSETPRRRGRVRR